MSEKEARPGLNALAIVCWILPLAGFVWGPGPWWAYALWLVAGTALLLVYDRHG